MKRILSEIFQIAIGIFLASIGLKMFLIPNGFLDGGATGIAILLSELFDIDISFFLILVSIPFLTLAWFSLSKRIFTKSLISIILLAVIIHFENFASVTEDKLLIAIFGGLFLGAGIGLSIRNGAVLDGSEVLGIVVNERFGISIGRVILFFNVILFGSTALLLSLEIAMYSILTFIVTAKVIDVMIEGFEDYVGLMIVSENTTSINEELIRVVGTGTTLYRGSGGFGKRGLQAKNDIIHTVINRIDIRRTYNLIDSIDKNAFIIEFDVNHIKGGIYTKVLSKEGLKKLSPTKN
ncbi:permease, putative [Psychroflexus torquis ATCC 700755]|uniref:Permease, putative n=1 Tax=Psychroflexus torquis (strain ATCC 700755 / CIP 106069 / ACAM 623) TaxID=313595 RepID=K4II22_PSYTT|nr:YitT family protein [Psychroflexus torquis]AFU69468.1 permease, putative [Psychroflexus torquis ATCC 700755]